MPEMPKRDYDTCVGGSILTTMLFLGGGSSLVM